MQQNCPSTRNHCPARLLNQTDLRDRLSFEKHRALDLLPPDQDVYREALGALRAVLLDGCPDCVRNTVAILATDLGLPSHRTLQLIVIEYLLAREVH